MIPALLLSLALSSPPAVAADEDPAALVLIVSSNAGARPGRAPLQYADDDGAKYHAVFSALAGDENTILLTELDRDTARLFPALARTVRPATRAQVALAADRLARKAAALKASGRAARFYFVFAGHGDVDEGRGFLELADGRFTADDLSQLVRTVGAGESHVILDSCNSFFVVNPRKPGGRRFATPRDAAERLARRLPNVGVFLSTSAQGEVFEWSELQSGVFSHAVRSGLLGAADADGDGRVSYEELAAFVETAAAEVKNPAFRPRVFARGPNGEDARAILDVRRAARAELVVDEPGAVRLAARDADGLRWVDAYKEAGSALRLWFPPDVADRLEIERLTTAGGQPQVEATFRLAPGGAGEARLAALAPAPVTLARRGAGEIFEALFQRPFGPAALASWRAERRVIVRIEVPEPEDERSEPEPRRPRSSAPATWATVRAGAAMPTMGAPTADPGIDGSLALGQEFYSFLGGELEAGYFDASGLRRGFPYPDPYSTYRRAVDATVRYQAVPVLLGVRLQLPRGPVRPYVALGAGVTALHISVDPADFNPTLRATRFVAEAHGGVGFTVDFTDRVYGGVEARYFAMTDARAFENKFTLSGLRTSLQLGIRI